MADRGLREIPVAEIKAGGMHATLYRVSARKLLLDTFDERNISGTYLSRVIRSETIAKQAFSDAVTRIMNAL